MTTFASITNYAQSQDVLRSCDLAYCKHFCRELSCVWFDLTHICRFRKVALQISQVGILTLRKSSDQRNDL
jgi:hypothetical protein